MASRGLTVKEAQDFPDIEIKWCEKVTLGESARKKMDKTKRNKERECILQGICALLNSGGGVLTLDIANSYDYRREGRGLDIEQHLLDLVGSPIEDMIEFIPQGDKVHIYVRTGHPHYHRSRLCSINTGLWGRAGANNERVNSKDMSEFLKKRRDRAERTQEENEGHPPAKRHTSLPGNEIIRQQAEEFYKRVSVKAGERLEFGESVHVELKQFGNSENLSKRLREVVPKNMSAFANTDGGFMFVGIDDESQKVIGCGRGVDAVELLGAVKELCNKSEAIHTSGCSKTNGSWSPECKLIKVIAQESSEADGYVVAIKIPAFCCAVFEQDPNSWHFEEGTVCRLGATVWMEKMQLSDPDDLCECFWNVLSLQDAPPQCKPVYSIEELTHLQEKLFPVPENNIEVVPDTFKNKLLTDVILTANSAKSPGICICSQSWAVDIHLPKNNDVICEALIISTGSYPTLCCVVETASPDLREYATTTAFHLKQKLVNLGGYTGKLCVIPQLVESQNWTVMNHHLQYPNSYRLQEKDVRALLRSLVIVVMSFTSPLSDEIGCEFLNLLTEQQFEILKKTYGGIKDLFIHGVPGSGKTLIAMALIGRIKNFYSCEEKNILYLCENVGLREFMRKQNLCQCETRVKFLAECTDFSAVKHIIVDEAQNFRVEKGESNWYEKALKLRGADGMFWIFLDYHQKCHDFPDGLPPISNQNSVVLHKVVRNSANVLKAMQPQMQRLTEGPQSEITRHLAAIDTQMELSHSFQGSCINIEVAPGNEVHCVIEILQRLHCHTPGDIAVLFSTQEELTAEEFNLKVKFPNLFSSVEENNPGKVVLDTVRRFSGLERNIVILVNPSVHPFLQHVEPNFLISAYSRARVRLYVVKPR